MTDYDRLLPEKMVYYIILQDTNKQAAAICGSLSIIIQNSIHWQLEPLQPNQVIHQRI